MTNKYLEKVALNAFKARSMAKAVGIIPDHTSAWKHAVRNLRDPRGNALQGKALHEARAKLGDISNNSLQKIKSISNNQGGLKGYEFAGRIENGKLKNIRKGQMGGVDDITPSDNFHTHPGTLRVHYSKYSNFMTSLPHRDARPSGLEGIAKLPSSHHRALITAKFEHRRLDNAHKNLTNVGNIIASKPIESLNTLPELNKHLDKFNRIDGALARVNSNKKVNADEIQSLTNKHNRRNGEVYNADAGVMAQKVMNTGYKERIVSTSHNSVSVNRLRPQGIRTVYFDHTPRKAK